MHERNDTTESEANATGGYRYEQCSVCGSAIETAEWYPIRVQSDQGDFQLKTFCSADCLDIWTQRELDGTEATERNRGDTS